MSYTKKRTVIDVDFTYDGDKGIWIFGNIGSDENGNGKRDYHDDIGLPCVVIEIDDMYGTYKDSVITTENGHFEIHLTGEDVIKDHYYLFRFAFKSTEEYFGVERKLPIKLSKYRWNKYLDSKK